WWWSGFGRRSSRRREEGEVPEGKIQTGLLKLLKRPFRSAIDPLFEKCYPDICCRFSRKIGRPAAGRADLREREREEVHLRLGEAAAHRDRVRGPAIPPQHRHLVP